MTDKKVHILYDYDDIPIKASCNGRKLQALADEMNGGANVFGPYQVYTLDLEDWEKEMKPTDDPKRIERIDPVKIGGVVDKTGATIGSLNDTIIYPADSPFYIQYKENIA